MSEGNEARRPHSGAGITRGCERIASLKPHQIVPRARRHLLRCALYELLASSRRLVELPYSSKKKSGRIPNHFATCLDPAADRNEITAEVHRLILATDMSRHADYMRHLRALLAEPRAAAASAAAGPAEALRRRRLTSELLIKCADTSNVIKPFSVAQRWAVRARARSEPMGGH